MTRKFKLIAIGGSAGSLQVILKFFKHLRQDFPISFLLVLHRNNSFDSSLEELLGFRTNLIVKEVEEKEAILPGHVYVCPADYHVLIEEDFTFSLDYSEKVNYSRPSIDVVFISAADVFGRNLLCILLSGANADGAEGVKHAQYHGALIVVQDPADAEVPYMPEQAILLAKPDYILKAKDMAPFINSLV